MVRGLLFTLSRLLGAQSPAYQALFTFLRRGARVGADPLGHVYYEGPARPGYGYTRRWVAYPGRPDPSAIPPRYHAWLHHQTAAFPDDPDAGPFVQPWAKPHAPNLTGTDAAWHPPGDLRAGGTRAPARGDYRAWTPGEDAA
jgi:NADH:ubiquinone oxidoreductase subunit